MERETGGGGLMFEEDPALTGLNAGIERAARHGLAIEMPERSAPEDDPYRVVPAGEPSESYPPELQAGLDFAQSLQRSGEASARFTELFSEMVALATIARRHYNDPELSEDELRSYSEHSFEFFNSFRHA